MNVLVSEKKVANDPLNQMATESPVRMVEGGGAGNWPSSKDSAMCGSQLKNVAAEELGLLLKGTDFMETKQT